MFHHDEVLQIRCPGVCFYVLRDGESLYVIDGGFIGGIPRLNSALKARGWEKLPIKGLLVTHGHLDHIFNVAAISSQADCWVAAPLLDLQHYDGKAVYRGTARVCGWLEALGRRLFGFRTFQVDRLLSDDDLLPIWGGLQAIHLPGHTPGHMGYYSPKLRLLFCGDLFASFKGFAHLPPGIFKNL